MPTLSANPGEQVPSGGTALRLSHSVEFGLLLTCCHAELHEPQAPDFLAREVSLIQDWDRVLELGEHHGVLPAIHRVLCQRNEAHSVQIPAEVRGELERRAAHLAKKNLRLAAELIRILSCLDEAGVAAIPHKGPVLAETIYGDLALRDFSDLDVLMRAEDIPRAKLALAQIGYQPNIELSSVEERAYLASGYEYTLDGPAGRNLLELQWNFVPRFFAVDFDMNAVFFRAGNGIVAGRAVRVLAPEALFLAACVHAAKHLWGRLCWLRDLAWIVECTKIDWDWVEHEAKRLGVQRIVAVSLSLAQTLLGADIAAAQSVQGSNSPDEQVQVPEITTAVAQHIPKAEEYSTESIDYVRWMLRLRERSSDRWRYLSRLLFTPSLGEWDWIRLPEPLFPLYRGVRLLRVSGRLLGSPGR